MYLKSIHSIGHTQFLNIWNKFNILKIIQCSHSVHTAVAAVVDWISFNCYLIFVWKLFNLMIWEFEYNSIFWKIFNHSLLMYLEIISRHWILFNIDINPKQGLSALSVVKISFSKKIVHHCILASYSRFQTGRLFSLVSTKKHYHY